MVQKKKEEQICKFRDLVEVKDESSFFNGEVLRTSG